MNTWEEEAIGQHVKTNGKPKGISHSTRMSIVDSTPVEPIHSNVIRHLNEGQCDYIDTDEKLFLLMQESYPSTYDDYDITNDKEKMAISILKTAIVPKLSYSELRAYNAAITRINLYRLSHYIVKIPVGLLTTEKPNVLLPVYATWFDSDPTNEYGRKMTSYIEQIRLMCVEVEVIKMITTGVITKMS